MPFVLYLNTLFCLPGIAFLFSTSTWSSANYLFILPGLFKTSPLTKNFLCFTGEDEALMLQKITFMYNYFEPLINFILSPPLRYNLNERRSWVLLTFFSLRPSVVPKPY